MGIFLFKKNMLRCPKCEGYADKTDGYKICPKCGCELITQYEYESYYHPPVKPTVKCPYCQSTNTKKISTTAKVVNTAVWGVFGTKRHKEWHCNDCGSDF